MAFFRISELPAGPGAVPGGSLLEVSVSDNSTVSGYESYKLTVDELFTDRTFLGNLYGPTAPPGTNDNQLATTEFVTYAVAHAPYLPLIGGTLSGPLYAPYVRVSDQYVFADRTGVNNWVWYAQDGSARLHMSGDKLRITEAGDLWVAEHITAGQHLYVNGSAQVFGALDVNGDSALMSISLGTDFANRKGWFDGGSGYGHLDANLSIGTGANYLSLYDDGNSHIESQEQLWLNSNGKPTVAGGTLTTLSGRLLSTNGYAPSVSVYNPGDGSSYGMWNEFNQLHLGKCNTVGVPTNTFAVWNTDGYLTNYNGVRISHNVIAGLVMAAPGGYDSMVEYSNDSQKWDVGLHGGTNFVWITTPPGQAGVEVGKVVQLGAWGNLTGSWFAYSSAELKQDIQPYSRGLDAIKALNPVSFRYRAGAPFNAPDQPSAPQIGLIAEEAREHLPEIVTEMGAGDDPTLSINPTWLIYPLIRAVQELAEMVEDLRDQYESLR